MSIRKATHAGSWYTDNPARLDAQLARWLEEAIPAESDGYTFPIAGCKAVIGPHAGYEYSGSTAAWAYKCIDPVGIKRVFILGPSHHVYLDGCALSRCKEYETPIGNLPLDLDTIDDLRKTGVFSEMSLSTDEQEHSIEMHLPYVRKVFMNMNIKIVPILVGAINTSTEKSFGNALAPYLARKDTICVVSSDFCHWGARFQYTFYYPSQPGSLDAAGVRLTRGASNLPSKEFPIYKSISALDHQALNILTIPPLTAARAHDEFAVCLERTKNTVCGRHPIGVLLGALAELENSTELGQRPVTMKWVRYTQSNQCVDVSDSSVSYASAFVVF